MDIKHRISINSIKDIEFMSTIIALGIDYTALELPGGSSKLVTFTILESDHRWLIVSNLIAKYGAIDMVDTFFSNEEICNSEWLRLISTHEQGYPQPKGHWPIKQLSYEIICPECCIYRQTSNMRLAKEPSLRKKSFMSLICAGEIFCVPDVVIELESIQAKGYEVKEAVIHKTSKPSSVVSQLYISGLTSPGIINNDGAWKRTHCFYCGTTKYFPHLRGKMTIKRESLLPGMDFILTHEWFGHGLLAWREILVSNRIARLVLNRGWQGVRFKVG